eukprot:15437108-Alexandrium_andersonii.AAC.1
MWQRLLQEQARKARRPSPALNIGGASATLRFQRWRPGGCTCGPRAPQRASVPNSNSSEVDFNRTPAGVS